LRKIEACYSLRADSHRELFTSCGLHMNKLDKETIAKQMWPLALQVLGRRNGLNPHALEG